VFSSYENEAKVSFSVAENTATTSNISTTTTTTTSSSTLETSFVPITNVPLNKPFNGVKLDVMNELATQQTTVTNAVNNFSNSNNNVNNNSNLNNGSNINCVNSINSTTSTSNDNLVMKDTG
jgi:hypothetical protein